MSEGNFQRLMYPDFRGSKISQLFSNFSMSSWVRTERNSSIVSKKVKTTAIGIQIRILCCKHKPIAFK